MAALEPGTLVEVAYWTRPPERAVVVGPGKLDGFIEVEDPPEGWPGEEAPRYEVLEGKCAPVPKS